MSQDIDAALKSWDFRPGVVQARSIKAQDGREVLQMRVDLGVLQMETQNRPDGTRPHGCTTYFDYLRREARAAARAGQRFVLSEEQCQESDREFVQFYHRRICWLALSRYAPAIEDADHTLAFMDFVRDHSPGEEYTNAHERYRGFVMFHRTQAAASLAVDQGNAEAAVDEVRAGLERMRSFFAQFGAEERMEEDAMIKELRQLERRLRESHGIRETLREQLDKAVAAEDYESAAKLRDALRRRESM
jgi:hypothetical protein